MQVLNLSDGAAAFIPIGGTGGASFHLANGPLNGQGIEFVTAEQLDMAQTMGCLVEGDEAAAAMTADGSTFSPGGSQHAVEPIYVNEKQYARILKRRAARAKLEMEGRIPKQRRVSTECGLFIFNPSF